LLFQALRATTISSGQLKKMDLIPGEIANFQITTATAGMIWTESFKTRRRPALIV